MFDLFVFVVALIVVLFVGVDTIHKILKGEFKWKKH